jgi:hypothetical protein
MYLNLAKINPAILLPGLVYKYIIRFSKKALLGIFNKRLCLPFYSYVFKHKVRKSL